MSVPKSRRGESEMEFIYNARQLQLYTIRKCVAFPKRYTFYVSQPLVNDSKQIHDNVKMANSIFPSNAHEAQIRRDYLLKAYAGLHSMVSQLEVARELIGIDGRVMSYWVNLIISEIRLVQAVIRRDAERFGKFQ